MRVCRVVEGIRRVRVDDAIDASPPRWTEEPRWWVGDLLQLVGPIGSVVLSRVVIAKSWSRHD
jgi:hypothetical protein